MRKPERHQRPRVINRKGEVVGGNAPGKFKLRMDLAADMDPNTPVVLRCARCPKWSAKTTMGRRAARWQSHLNRRHGGK